MTHIIGKPPAPKGSIAQVAAAENWGFFKSQVRYWRSWKYTPSSHPQTYAMWVADMRNAWVAYHAGAPWMERMDTLRTTEAVSLETSLLIERHEVARLTAEVERWRVKADDLRRLVFAKRIETERLQGQLAEARAEVGRLRPRPTSL